MFELDPIFFLLTILITAVLLLVPSVAWLLFRLKRQREYYEGIIKEARAKAETIINEAKIRSQETLMEVDKNVSKYLSERKTEVDSVHDEFVRQLEVLRKEARETLSEASEKVSLFSDNLSESAGEEIERSVKEANLAIQNVVNNTKEKIDGELIKLSEKIPVIDESLQEIESLNKDAKRRLSEGLEIFFKISKEISEEARKNLDISANEASNVIKGLAEETRGHMKEIRNDLDISAKETSDIIKGLSEDTRGHMKEARKNLDISAKEASNVIKGLTEEIRGHMKDDTAKVVEELTLVRSEISQHFRESLKTEMDEMRKEIESYKKDRLRVVDEHIVTLVEETASIALNAKLSKDDHREVVHNALKEAKNRGAFERS